MNKYHLILAAVIAMTSASNQAQESKPDNEWSGNAALVSDYSYRGISQTRLQPALQGAPTTSTTRPACMPARGSRRSNGSPTKAAAGAWNGICMQGSAATLLPMWLTTCALSYVYAGNALNPNANTTELYGQLSYKAILQVFAVDDEPVRLCRQPQ